MRIHFMNDKVRKIYKNNGGVKTADSVGFDLCTIEDIEVKKDTTGLIELGVIIKPEDGFFTAVYPRSSTHRKYGLIQANSVGIIDPDYCGENDYIKFPYLALRGCKIPAGTAIAQAIQIIKLPFSISEFDPQRKSRGGFGSTDKEAK